MTYIVWFYFILGIAAQFYMLFKAYQRMKFRYYVRIQRNGKGM